MHRRGPFGIALLGAALTLLPPMAFLARADACPEANDTADSACIIGIDSPVAGTIERPDDQDAYLFNAPEGTVAVHARLSYLPADYDLHLVDAQGNVRCESTNPGLVDEAIDCPLGPGQYYLYVNSGIGQASEAPYTLTVKLDRWIELARETDSHDRTK